MAIKQNRGPLVLLVVLVTAAAFVAFWQRALPEEPRVEDAALTHLKGQFASAGMREGEDFTIGNVDILSLEENKALARAEIRPLGDLVYLELLRVSGKWVVTRNLLKDFQEYCRETEGQIQDRLGSRLAEMYKADLKMKPGIKTCLRLREDREGILGTIEVRFGFPETESGPRAGSYSEAFRYRDGRWVQEGAGRLLQQLPRPRPEPPEEEGRDE